MMYWARRVVTSLPGEDRLRRLLGPECSVIGGVGRSRRIALTTSKRNPRRCVGGELRLYPELSTTSANRLRVQAGDPNGPASSPSARWCSRPERVVASSRKAIGLETPLPAAVRVVGGASGPSRDEHASRRWPTSIGHRHPSNMWYVCRLGRNTPYSWVGRIA